MFESLNFNCIWNQPSKRTTSLQRRCNVTTLQQHCNDIYAMLCVCWVTAYHTYPNICTVQYLLMCLKSAGRRRTVLALIRHILWHLISVYPAKDCLSQYLGLIWYYKIALYLKGFKSNIFLQESGARLDMERSKAIKCPSVHYQLAGCKKIQQELAAPGSLERFITDKSVLKRIRSTFAGQYTLDRVGLIKVLTLEIFFSF